MAKLRAVVESLDGVPEGLRELYVEVDGKYRLDADGVEDVSGLRSALEKEKRTLRDLKSRIPEGFDPDRWTQLLALEEEASKGKLTDKQREEAEVWRSKVLEGHRTELQKREDAIKDLERELERRLVDADGAAAIAAAEGSVDLLMPLIKQSAKVIQHDGKRVAVVLDADGQPRINPKDGGHLTINEYVSELKATEKYARAFNGTGSSGSGAQRSAGGAGNTRTIAADDGAAFMRNLTDVAKGTAQVRVPA